MHTDDAREQGFERALRQSLAAPAAIPSGDCVDAETLAAWSDGSLAPLQAASVELHLSSCPSCQTLLAAFARATPAQPAALPLWRRWQLQWLVPLATATAALTIWLVVPGRTPAQLEPVREDRPVAQLSAPSSPPVPSEAREQSSRFAAPSSLATPPPGLPAPAAARANTPPAQPRAAAAADALAKSAQEKQKKEVEADQRVAALAAEAPPPPVAVLPRTVEAEPDARARAVLPPAPPAGAGTAAPATAAPAAAPTPGRQEQVAGVLAQSSALKVSSIEVASPTSATRWRIVLGGTVEYFGKSASSGRPTDIPAPAPLIAGSSPQDDVCWMVGRGGTVYLTTDGLHFSRIAFPDAVDLVAVRATDANTVTVTAATGRTYRTADAGKSWQ